MDKKTIAAIVISLGIWLTWQKLYWEPYQKAQKEWKEYQAQQVTPTEKTKKSSDSDSLGSGENFEMSAANAVESGNAISVKGKSTQSINNVPATIQTLKLTDSDAIVSNTPYLVEGWTIQKYLTQGEDKKPIDLLYHSGVLKQFAVSFSEGNFTGEVNKTFKIKENAKDEQYKQEAYTDYIDSNSIFMERKISKAQTDYTLDVNIDIQFKEEPPKYVFVDLFGNTKRDHDTKGSIFGETPDKVELVYWNKEGRHGVAADHVVEKIESLAGINWLGINTRYFLFALIPQQKELATNYGLQIQSITRSDQKLVQARMVIPTNGEKNLSIPYKMYFGPKKLELLEAISPSLGNAIDFGWTSMIAIPLLKMLKAVYKIVGNYGLAIIIVTLFVKILLFPLTYKSMKSMAKLSRLKPEMEKIQKKYADDKQKLNQEIWSLYKNNGANPLSGCLPMLLQMPVFFALYRVLFNCMELYQAPFFLWIHDLSAKDPLFITPVLLIVLMFLQQRINPQTGADPSQQAAMKFMPVLFGAFMLFLPSGLNIYMLINTKVSLLQQYLLNKRFGVGRVTVT